MQTIKENSKAILTILIVIYISSIFWPMIANAEGNFEHEDQVMTSNQQERNTAGQDKWKEVKVTGNISHSNYEHYKLLFKEENFSLIAKLMTLFLIESEKGYKINEIDNQLKNTKRFSIQSLNTIQEGSYIDIQSMNEKGFTFTGKLLIEKVGSFDCDIKVDIKYLEQKEDVAYKAKVYYQAPSIVNGLMGIFSVFTGKDYISYKLLNFIDNLHLVLEKMNNLELDTWYELANNQELLSDLVFPIEFTPREIRLIAIMLKR